MLVSYAVTATVSATLLSVALAAAPGLTPDSHPAAGLGTCDGLPVTIVGTGLDQVFGTEGDDVVLTDGAPDVQTLGGDDRVCITGSAGVGINTGPGDDRVTVVTSDAENVYASLGTGTDVFSGGPEPDLVFEDRELDRRDGYDVIDTGAGDDIVGVDGTPKSLHDHVVLGSGDDELRVQAQPGPGFMPRGGPGRDRLYLYSFGTSGWRLDNRTHEARHRGARVFGWRSFQDFGGYLAGASFRGGPSDEAVDLDDPGRMIRLGAGDDDLVLPGASELRTVAGGPGHDTLATSGLRVRADLRAQRLEWTGPVRVIRIRQFEAMDVTAVYEATLRGSARAENLHGTACTVHLSGRGGNDRLTAGHRESLDCNTVLIAHGGRGNDRMVGASANRSADDRLMGGPGRDRADGRSGDVCRAEIRIDCERR